MYDRVLKKVRHNLCMYVRTCVRMYMRMYVCMYACAYVFMYARKLPM
jgi:hypothetical protein